MFFRIKKTPTGQTLQLVESFRDLNGKPRQRIVVSLGSDAIPKKHWDTIATAVEKRLYGFSEMFPQEFPKRVQRWIDIIIRKVDLKGRWQPLAQFKKTLPVEQGGDGPTVINGVIADGVEHTSPATLGPYLVGLQAWQQLSLDDCLKRLGFNDMQRKAAAISVVSRLVEPQSELGMASHLHQTALPELVGEASLTWSKDRFYRVSDKLVQNEAAIESHIRKQQQELFSLSRSVFLYDLTNTYFEGTARENPKAKRGKSKHKRNDCPQVVVGMVFDENGFEVGHGIFEGNRSESKTLLEMVRALDQCVGEEASLFKGGKPTVIMDAGVATRENLELLRNENYSYLVNDSRRGRKKYQEEFQKDEEFEAVEGRQGKREVKVRKLKDPLASGRLDKVNENGVQESAGAPQPGTVAEGDPGEDDWRGDHLILCKSAARRDKELAIISKTEEKLLAAVQALEKRVGKGRLKDPTKIDEAIGRLRSRYPRVARYYEVKRIPSEPAAPPRDVIKSQISWTRKDDTHEEDDELLGCYVLRTDREDLDAGEFWNLYITLTRAEDGFRALKSDLGLRPNHHRIEDRVDGHIFITILAYHLLQTILHVFRGVGDTRSWQTLKKVLQPHSYTTMIFPTETGEIHRIRKAGLPDASQKAIYETLKTDYLSLSVIKTHSKTQPRSTTL